MPPCDCARHTPATPTRSPPCPANWELGYPSDPAPLTIRLATLLAAPEQHFICVVEVNGTVCGWIHGFVRPLRVPESDTRVEIGGLVVGAWRGQGLGAAPLEACEQWVRASGIGSVTLRSAEHRRDAHCFYLRRGYRHIKTQLALRKTG